MTIPSFENLSINEEGGEEGFCFDIEKEESEIADLRLCLIRRFLCDKHIHVKSMKGRIANIWRSVKGVAIKEATDDLFLFQFEHKLDMEAVINGGHGLLTVICLYLKKSDLEYKLKIYRYSTLISSTVIKEQEGLCEEAKHHFTSFFTTLGGSYEQVLNLFQPVVKKEDNVKRLRPIAKEELYVALCDMHPNKSPGPDDFNPAFYQRYWYMYGDDIWQAATDWLSRGYFPPFLNDINICLIPKCNKPQKKQGSLAWREDQKKQGCVWMLE